MARLGLLVPNIWHLLVLFVAGISAVSSQELVTDDETFAIGE
jgi:hypothetical protein